MGSRLKSKLLRRERQGGLYFKARLRKNSGSMSTNKFGVMLAPVFPV
jgi:hypothetical protein